MKTIYELDLHEETQTDKYTWIMRVPGGWIYRYESETGVGGWHVSSVFVPFHNEFQE